MPFQAHHLSPEGGAPKVGRGREGPRGPQFDPCRDPGEAEKPADTGAVAAIPYSLFPYPSFQRAPCGVSSITTPRPEISSRIASAAAKSRD